MNPYRIIVERPKDQDDALPDPEWAHGELTIAAMLIVVGGLAVCSGLIGDGAGRDVPFGAVLLMLGLRVLVVEWRSARSREGVA